MRLPQLVQIDLAVSFTQIVVKVATELSFVLVSPLFCRVDLMDLSSRILLRAHLDFLLDDSFIVVGLVESLSVPLEAVLWLNLDSGVFLDHLAILFVEVVGQGLLALASALSVGGLVLLDCIGIDFTIIDEVTHLIVGRQSKVSELINFGEFGSYLPLLHRSRHPLSPLLRRSHGLT